MKLSVLLLFSLTVGSQTVPIRPDPVLTPGEVASTDTALVCKSGYSKSVRHTSKALKIRIFAEYGVKPNRNFEIDHRVSLSLGGADTRLNMWPESYLTKPYNAHVKDRLEDFLHIQVCHKHTMTLVNAQRILEGDWIAEYNKYIGKP